jgi:hypothetical protein
LVHAELARNQSERRALLVACRGQGYRLIGHLSGDAPSGNAGPVEVVADGGPVDCVLTSGCVDRGTLSVQVDQLFDLRYRQPSLNRV